MSDVLELYDETGCTFYYCDTFGFDKSTHHGYALVDEPDMLEPKRRIKLPLP